MIPKPAPTEDDDADDVSPSAPFGELEPGQSVVNVTDCPECAPGWIVDEHANVSPPPVKH